MEGKSEITVKDWIEHLHWQIDKAEERKRHNNIFRIPTLTLFIISLSTLVTSILIFQWIYVILSLLGAFGSYIMIHILNITNQYLENQTNDMAILMNDLLIYDKIDIDHIRIEYMKICSKYLPLGKTSQKRLEELKMKKAK